MTLKEKQLKKEQDTLLRKLGILLEEVQHIKIK